MISIYIIYIEIESELDKYSQSTDVDEPVDYDIENGTQPKNENLKEKCFKPNEVNSSEHESKYSFAGGNEGLEFHELKEKQEIKYPDNQVVPQMTALQGCILPAISEEDEKKSSSQSKTTSSSDKLENEASNSDSSKKIQKSNALRNFENKLMSKKYADNTSVSSSLLEFESLEKEIQEKGSIDSVSLGRLSTRGITERDDASVTSSLAEFEKLEKECLVPSDSQGTGSKSSSSSNVDFEMGRDGHKSQLTEQLRSSSSSLAEFEQLEQQLTVDEEVSVEARKVASMLEKGSLPIKDDFSDSDSSKDKSSKDGQEVKEKIKPTEKPIYPPYQDIVQIIRQASEKVPFFEDFRQTVSPKSAVKLQAPLLKSGIVTPDVAQRNNVVPQSEFMDISSDSLSTAKTSAQSLLLGESEMFTSTDSLEDEQADEIIQLMMRSTDSLEDQQHQESFDTDSLQDMPTIITKSMSQDSLKETIAEAMEISAESGAWSRSSSQQSSATLICGNHTNKCAPTSFGFSSHTSLMKDSVLTLDNISPTDLKGIDSEGNTCELLDNRIATKDLKNLRKKQRDLCFEKSASCDSSIQDTLMESYESASTASLVAQGRVNDSLRFISALLH